MPIWSAEIKELEKLYESFKGQLPSLGKELEQLIKTDDANVIMLYSRRCLEVIITDLCECELKRPRGTEPLKGIIDKLHKERKVPDHISTSMHGLNDLSTYGTHPKDFDPEQVKPVLNNLDIIIKWYLKYKDVGIDFKAKPGEEIREDIKSTEDVKKSTQIPKKRLIGLVSGLVLLIVIVVAVLFLTDIIGNGKPKEETDKSIAVIPFTSMSDDPAKQYLADGVMDAILLHLSKIRDLRVIARTSVEQYRKTNKTTTTICKELDVGYLLEGSFQKYGDNAKLIVQLIKAGKGSHVWAKDYDRNWNDVLKVQSEVAQTVAKELYASITPAEKQLIEKVSTSNMTAYDLYLKANDFLKEYEKTNDSSFYQNAVTFYNAALVIDPSFAKAYTGLARAYFDRYYWTDYFKENFLDSCLFLVKRALSIDDQLDEAYYIKGEYYLANGKPEEALDNYDKALKINPNYFLAYTEKGYILRSQIHDFVQSLEIYPKALALSSGNERAGLIRDLGGTYFKVGFIDKAKFYYQEAFNLDSNKIANLEALAWLESSLENFEEAMKLYKRAYKIDSTYLPDLMYYSVAGHDEEAYLLAKRWIEHYNKTGELNLTKSNRVGYAFWQVGKHEEAKNYFNQQIKYDEKSIKFSRDFAKNKLSYYNLAATYAFLDNKAKAYQYLDDFNTMNFYPFWILSVAKQDPLFANIRNEERFQKILQNMEAKYQAEHNRVSKWLEEQGML